MGVPTLLNDSTHADQPGVQPAAQPGVQPGAHAGTKAGGKGKAGGNAKADAEASAQAGAEAGAESGAEVGAKFPPDVSDDPEPSIGPPGPPAIGASELLSVRDGASIGVPFETFRDDAAFGSRRRLEPLQPSSCTPDLPPQLSSAAASSRRTTAEMPATSPLYPFDLSAPSASSAGEYLLSVLDSSARLAAVGAEAKRRAMRWTEEAYGLELLSHVKRVIGAGHSASGPLEVD